jgi:Arc/MetJ-type ribon-helix-helix transcriptional regulator
MMSSRKKLPMTRQNADRDLAKGAIQLSSDQEQAIREAIQSGIIRSVDEFIEMAIAALRRPENQNENARRDAVRLMEEFGEKYHLSMGGPVTRESLHKGHRY